MSPNFRDKVRFNITGIEVQSNKMAGSRKRDLTKLSRQLPLSC